MAAEAAPDLRQLEFCSSSSAALISLRLKESLEACSSSIESEDFIQSDEAVASVTTLFHSLLESSTSELEETLPGIELALDDIYRFVSSPDSNQKVVEALSFELPKLVINFAPLSAKCRQIAGGIIEFFVSVCNPREMLSVLCEALSSCSDNFKALGCYSHIMLGLSKVLLRIQKHHIEQVKVVLPVFLGVLNVASLEADEDDKDSLSDLFSAAISIGSSIHKICQKLEGQRKELLRAILGLYVLQNIALISRACQMNLVDCSLLVAEFSKFLPFCGVSYFGLLSRDFDMIKEICKDEGDEFVASFSSAVCGASLTVIWGHISEEVVKAAGEHLDVVVNEIRKDRFRRWQALGMLRHTLACSDYPWMIKSHGIDILLIMIDGIISREQNECVSDLSASLPDLLLSLMAIEKIIMGAPDPSLRKKAFGALKMVLSDIPCSWRFDTLKALIINSNSPSMVAILIDIVKGEILVDSPQGSSRNELNRKEISKFWGTNALGIVEMVLRPPKGGPPSLPEHSEQVLSALNLYRFIIIIELTGKTNSTGILSEDSLQKAYSTWFMPLRTLVSGILAENENDRCELSESIICALSPVQLVLYRCIELVEESLKCL